MDTLKPLLEELREFWPGALLAAVLVLLPLAAYFLERAFR
jgi:hypothetical protein